MGDTTTGHYHADTAVIRSRPRPETEHVTELVCTMYMQIWYGTTSDVWHHPAMRLELSFLFKWRSTPAVTVLAGMLAFGESNRLTTCADQYCCCHCTSLAVVGGEDNHLDHPKPPKPVS